MLSFSQYLEESMSAQKALKFIQKAHAGQKYGNAPYWTHPKAVADIGKKFFGSKFDTKTYIAALLHDVIEDTPYKEAELKKLGFDDDILSAVKLLTKDKSMSYADNIQRIIQSGNRRAMMVKYADNYVNFTGDKSAWDPEKKAASQAKYKKSIETIGGKLGVTADLPENFVNNTATSIKLIKKYYQTGNEKDAFAAIKHGWNFIKNPTIRSMIVKLVKKVGENEFVKYGDPKQDGTWEDQWNQTVTYIKKNTGIDVSNVNENFDGLAERYMKSLNTLGEALGVKSDWTINDSQMY